MVSAGIPLHQCLYYLAEQESDPVARRFYESTLENLESGRSFTASLKASSQDLGELNLTLLNIAERTGSLETVLRRITEYETRADEVRKRVFSQLVYPCFLGLFGFLTLLFLPGYCLEGMISLLRNEGGELPFLSRLFFQLSETVSSFPFVVGLALIGVALFLFLRKAWRNESARARALDVVDGIPVARNVLSHWRLAFLSDTLALQLSVGLSPLKAFPLAAQAIHDPRAIEYAQNVVRAIKDGRTVPESLREWPGLPSLFLSMAQVGEESGRWPALLRKLAEYHHRELEDALDRFVTLLEPVVLSVMGVLFGLMMVASLTPMLSLIEGL